MKQITVCFACLFFWLVSTSRLRAETPEKKRPNVLFIISDDLNTALSGFGHPHCKTPNIDKLSKAGVTFTRAFCQWPICGPSRASIFSGQYPEKNGVTGNGGRLNPERVTLPLHFRQHGYWSGRVSKIYHMGIPGDILQGRNGRDHEASWVERYNVRAMEAITPGKAEDLTGPDSTSLYPELRKKWAGVTNRNADFKIPGNHMGSDYVVVETEDRNDLLPDAMAADRALSLLRTRAREKQPFFLAVGFVRPHSPYVAPAKDFAQYEAKKLETPHVPEDDAKDFPPQLKVKPRKISMQDHKKVLRGYYGSISYMDRQVGRLLAELDRLRLRDDTIVVFCSDHGYLHGEHRMWKKNLLWEEAIRAPLIISAPSQKARGVRCDRPVELVDLYPTLVELAGLPPEKGAQGLSLAELLDDPKAKFSRGEAFVQTKKGYGLRSDRWAYMWYPARRKGSEGVMLYDMSSDPHQYTNLAEVPKFASIRKSLQERLLKRISAARN